MQTINDVHQQFAEYFRSENLKPYAYLVSKKLYEGHICISLNDLDEETEQLPTHYKNKLIATDDLIKEPLVAQANEAIQPFILHNNRFYLQRYFSYETTILNRIKSFLSNEAIQRIERLNHLEQHRKFIIDLFKIISPTGTDSGSEKTDWQLTAAICAVINNFTIITGGPGTGKTTTVAKILAILFTINPLLKVGLAAPTGKAAARMAESLQSASLPVNESIREKFKSLEPSTIHRLLKYIPDSPYFKHNCGNPVNYDVIIVDESSMIDVALFAKLMDAIGPDTRLILLGDKDQLASVEAGSLFGDLCQAQEKLNLFSQEMALLINSFIEDPRRQINHDNIATENNHPLFQHIVELRHSHRFTGDLGIGKFSKAIINNDEAGIETFLVNADEQVFIDTHYSSELFERFILGYEYFIRENDIQKALKQLNKLKVLCALREGEQGVKAMNKKIERFLQQKKLLKITGEFYENRPIMVTHNYYDLNLYNGDIGIVRPDERGELKVWFENEEGGLKSIPPAYLTQSETVFAMTIHKSQGSEFNAVLVVLPDAPDIPILTRELLYTAITRARSEVYIQGNETVVFQSAKAFVKRASGIKERFFENTIESRTIAQ